MFISIRHYTVKPGSAAEVNYRVQRDFVPIVRAEPGFVAYYLVDHGNDTFTTLSIFQTQAQIDGSVALATEWVKDNLAGLVLGQPTVMGGEVSAYAGALMPRVAR